MLWEEPELEDNEDKEPELLIKDDVVEMELVELVPRRWLRGLLKGNWDESDLTTEVSLDTNGEISIWFSESSASTCGDFKVIEFLNKDLLGVGTLFWLFL